MNGAGYRSIWSHLKTVSFRQGWISAGGINTRFAQAGRSDAPAVIMLHGTGGSWEGFCANLGPLSEHFNCFAIDLIGSGYSDKPDYDYTMPVYVEHLRNFMHAVNVTRASFVGISMGTWIAARFALAHPEITDKLVLLAAFGMSDDEEEIGAILTRRGKAYDDPNWDTIKAIFNNLILDEKSRIDDLIALRLGTYEQPGMKAAGEHVLSVFGAKHLRSNLISATEWQQINAPTLVIASLRDRPLYLNTARTLGTLIPKATVVEMDNVAHWPQFEAPDEFNRIALDFLRR